MIAVSIAGETLLALALVAGPAAPVQRPDAPAPRSSDIIVDAPDAPQGAGAAESPTLDSVTVPVDGAATESIEPTSSAGTVNAPAPAPAPAVESSTDVPTTSGDESMLRVATERPGPPYYAEADLAELRARYEVSTPSSPSPSPVRWRCLIADPSCRHSFELQAMGGYALRARQGDVSQGTIDRWSSARIQYDLWASLPALVESEGKHRFTRMSLGPKGGVIFSDGGDLWGNLGIAARYWLGRGRWAPSIELTSALAFKIGSRQGTDLQEEKFRMQRGPVGFQADIGLGIGGFGSIVVGGQYDSPLAREDIPEEYRVVSSGMFYVAFRGNILWGGPAAVAVAAHASTRAVERP